MTDFLARLFPGDVAITWVASVLAQVTFVVLAALVVCPLLRRSAAARHNLWLAALVCVLLSPIFASVTGLLGLSLITLPLPTATAVTQRPEETPPVVVPSDDQPGDRIPFLSDSPIRSGILTHDEDPPSSSSELTPGPEALPLTQPGIPWHAIGGALLLAWGLGSLLLLARLVHGCCSLVVLRRGSRPFTGPTPDTTIDGRKPPPLFTSRSVTVPVAGGWLRPWVILPDGLAQSLSPTQLRDVLLHEAAHVLRRDALVGLLQRVAEILFWPHPLVHLLNRRLAVAREDACDDFVLRSTRAADYARTLVMLAERQHATRRPLIASGLLDGHVNLEHRIAGLLDPRRNPMTRTTRWRLAGLMAVLVAVTLAVAGLRLGADPPERGAPRAEDPTKARIEGTVVDEAGKPLAGFTVTAQDAFKPLKTTTGDDGSFRIVLDGPFVGLTSVVAANEDGSRQGLVRLDVPVTRSRKAACRVVVKPSRTITVNVVDGQGKPVAEASVGVLDDLHGLTRGRTDTRGSAAVRLPADFVVWNVFALKPGVGFDYFENYRARSGPALPVPAEVKLTLDGARTVTMRATDSADKPLAGVAFFPLTLRKKDRLADINLSSACLVEHVVSRTNEKGVAAFAWVPTTLVNGASFAAYSEDYYDPRGVYFQPDQPDAPLTAKLLTMTPLGGTVTGADGKPAPGVILQAEGQGETGRYYRGYARTAADGSYSLKVYPGQSYIAAVLDDEFAAASRTGVLVREGKAASDVDFRLGTGTTLQGAVLMGKDRKPAAGQTVTLVEMGKDVPGEIQGDAGPRRERLVRWAEADKDGRYSFRLGSGEYRISVGESQEVEFAVADEKKVEKDFHIPRPARARIKGVVLAKAVDGKPVAGAVVTSESIGNFTHVGIEAVADDRGRFEAERWTDRMFVYARNPEGTLATIVTIDEDETDVKLLLTEAGSLKGRLVDAKGKPVAGVQVLVGLQIGPENALTGRADLRTRTDAEGRFSVSGLVLGSRCLVYGYAPGTFELLKDVKAEKADAMDLGDLVFEPKPVQERQP